MLQHISYMQDREEVEEDAHQCKYCTDLCFMSMAMCKLHTMPSSNESSPSTEVSQTLTKQEKRAKQVSHATESHQYCIWHMGVCGCHMGEILVVYRFKTEELHQWMSMINAACSPSEGNSQESKRKSPKIPKLKPNAISFNFNPKSVEDPITNEEAHNI